MFPTTKIAVLADSPFHVLPATTVYNYFWTQVQWSPNPNAQHNLATKYAPNLAGLPTFDWTASSAISDMLRQYSGRVQILYIACNQDSIVVSDRESLSTY